LKITGAALDNNPDLVVVTLSRRKRRQRQQRSGRLRIIPPKPSNDGTQVCSALALALGRGFMRYRFTHFWLKGDGEITRPKAAE
jgi:hypothetical protein